MTREDKELLQKNLSNDTTQEERYDKERRGFWGFMPLWKKIICTILFPFVVGWLGLCWCIMKIGRGLYQFGDLLSGWKWDGDWLQEL